MELLPFCHEQAFLSVVGGFYRFHNGDFSGGEAAE
jgi:hypothetical protein